MKIALVNSVRIWAGAEVWTDLFARGMTERGHDAAVICRPGSELARRIPSGGRCTVHTAPIGGELNPLAYVRLRRLLRSLRPDVIIANRPKDVKIAGLTARLAGRTPLVHRNAAPSPLRDTALNRWIWTRYVARTVVPSQYKRRELIENARWMSDHPITVIPNGIDVNRFRPDPERGVRARTDLGLAASAFVAGYFGQVERRKRVEVLVRAAEMVRRRGRDTVLLVVGAGPEDATLRRQAAALAVPAIFTGFRRDVPDLMNACDVVVHPSIGESFGFAVAEAMACGRAVVAARACSLPELIEDGRTGFLFEPESADALAGILELLQHDPALRQRIGAAARRAAEARFSLPTMLDRWEGILQEVAESKS